MKRTLSLPGIVIALVLFIASLIVTSAAPVLSAGYRTHLFGWVNIDYGGMGIAINNQNLALCETASTDSMRSLLWQKDVGVTYISDPTALRRGYGLNNLGYVVGSGQDDTAVVRHPGGSIEILPRPSEAVNPSAAAISINDAGQVVGNMGGYAVFWNTDRATTIIGDDVLRFAGINASAQTAWTDQSRRSYLWSQSGGSVDLAPVAGQTRSTVFGINDSGLVVGESGNRAVLWRTPGNPTQLPLPPEATTGRAWGINSSEQTVGESGLRAVLWDSDGSVLDLSQFVGGYDSVATGINDNGWIVGTVYAPGGDLFAAVWEPVPEPSSLLVLACGMAGVSALTLKLRRAS
ncbi:MAG TPA: hypothetical protein VFI02_13455 [Armatimonadota bacterium]|nr:hypothetical protein [Armatimonadota bacterium]